MTVPNDANTYLPGTIQVPSSLVITGITNSYPMVVTTIINNVTEANTFIPGMVVSLNVPITYKMFQANGLQGEIVAVSGNDLYLDIDSRLFDVFLVPSSSQFQPASLSPSGSRNLEYNNNTANFVPFHSLNNRGN